MAAYNKFNSWVERLTEDANIGSDVFKLLVSNTLPLATNSVTADITQIANGNGYTTGGLTITTTSASQTGGVQKLVLADLTITATGSLGPMRYFIIVDSTINALVAWADYGSSVTLPNNGDTLLVDFDQTNGFITVT